MFIFPFCRYRMTESSARDDNMRSGSPASLNSLQIALFSMKERCTKQQRKIEDLEQENNLLNVNRSDLYSELKKLHEANVKLREKNVSLSHELHLKNKEMSEVRELWDRERRGHQSSVRQLERLQENILRTDDGSNSSEEEEDVISSLKPSEEDGDADANTCDNVVDNNCASPGDDNLVAMLDSSRQNMVSLKTSLVQQKAQLSAALDSLKQRRSVGDQAAERLISAVLTSAIARSGDRAEGGAGAGAGARCCPMCEAVFPADSSQEEFESHVVEHFSYEESDTLRHYDTVPDAYWPGIEHDPEM